MTSFVISWEEVNPGRAQLGLLPLTLRAGEMNSPFGRCLLAECSRGLRHLSFVDEGDRSHLVSRLSLLWPGVGLLWDDSLSARYSWIWSQPMDACADKFRARGVVRGTPFQLRVWQSLQQIPQGSLMTYSALATAAGHPAAARAVGSALSRNPLAYLLPCHRVVPSNGLTGQYRWGAKRKSALLRWEGNLSTRLVLASKSVGGVMGRPGKDRAEISGAGKAAQLGYG